MININTRDGLGSKKKQQPKGGGGDQLKKRNILPMVAR